MIPQPNPAGTWQWVGDALLLGAIPIEGRTERRMRALRRLLELALNASDADVSYELAQFKAHGRRRGS